MKIGNMGPRCRNNLLLTELTGLCFQPSVKIPTKSHTNVRKDIYLFPRQLGPESIASRSLISTLCKLPGFTCCMGVWMVWEKTSVPSANWAQPGASGTPAPHHTWRTEATIRCEGNGIKCSLDFWSGSLKEQRWPIYKRADNLYKESFMRSR